MQQKDIYSISKKYLEQEIGDFQEKELQTFQEIMEFHSELYYEKEAPIISDNEYDMLFNKLKKLEDSFWVESGVTQQVWSAGIRSSFKKVAHTRPMISLDNTYNEEELQSFDTRIKRILKDEGDIEYTIEYKFDGLWIELIYKKWKFLQAITRGNGIEGEDVTENVRQIQNIPKEIPYAEDIEIRGEVLMPLSSFEKLNREAKENNEKIFANPRNAASGSLRILDTSITKKRDLKFFAYDISDFQEYGEKKYFGMVNSLHKLGFEISSYFQKYTGISGVIWEIASYGEEKQKIDFEIDGLVIKVNNIDLWKIIGYTEHHPRYAIAYKFPAEIQTTKIESIEHSVWRTWTITPVANVEPIVLSGATIRRSTLHNYDEIEKLDIRERDRVFIKRAWEVIPKIISVVKEVRDGSEKKIEIPKRCPSCGSEIFKDEDKVRYYCKNDISCPAQNREQLAYSVGKGGFNIDGLWERQVEIFLAEWLIVNLVDIFYLKNRREEILDLEWFQELSVNNLLSAIEKVQKIDITTFLRSIGIPGVGKKTAKILGEYITRKLQKFPKITLSWILSLPEEKEAAEEVLLFSWREEMQRWGITKEELIELPDIGPEVAQNVIEFFTTRKEYVSGLLEVLEIHFPEKNIWKDWKYVWKKMCITGSFEWYSRDDLTEILEEKGWEFVWSVSKNTDYLLAGEKAGGKLKKATELGVEILSLDDFLSN